MDLSVLKTADLLALHASVSAELLIRKVLRSANNPTGDFAEYLVCRALRLTSTANSHPFADALGADGTLYQVKARRLTTTTTSRQLGAFRGLPSRGFDVLAAVLFESNYRVKRAALVPHHVVLERSRYIAHTNSWKFMLQDVVWKHDGVTDITELLKAIDCTS